MLGLPFFGKLEKLTILAYNKVSSSGIPESVPVPFQVMFNPTTFTESFSRNWQKKKTPGEQSNDHEYVSTTSPSIKLDFIFDATGASVNSPLATVAKTAGSVDVLIEAFKRICFRQQGETHEPRYLTLIWGTFIYSCILDSFSVTYDLFAPSGRPLRAKVSCTFEEQHGRLLDALLTNRLSPDLTHTWIVKAGDTLYNIAKEVYDDPQLYLEIARVNNINNPRNLTTGDVIVLPPINQNVAS